MMDSQEKALEQGMTEEVSKVEETVEQTVELDEASQVETVDGEIAAEAEIERKSYDSKKDVLVRIREIAQDDAPKKDEVDYLKTVFYKLHNAEREAVLAEEPSVDRAVVGVGFIHRDACQPGCPKRGSAVLLEVRRQVKRGDA